MVRVTPFATFKYLDSTQSRKQHFDALPNRFNNSGYDRSVYEDEECVGIANHCKCLRCSGKPVAVVSDEGSALDTLGITSRNIREYVAGDILEEASHDSFLLYEQRKGGHIQRGICAAIEVSDILKGNVKKHENTLGSKCSYKQVPANRVPKDPLMIMYRGEDAVNAVIKKIIDMQSPDVTIKDTCTFLGESVPCEHNIWVVSEQSLVEEIQSIFEDIKPLYIADGHHRSEAACIGAVGFSSIGVSMPPNIRYVMAFLYSHDDLQVLPFHRCIKNVFCDEDFLKELEELLHGTYEYLEFEEHGTGCMQAYYNGSWKHLRLREERSVSSSDPIRSLDVQILESQIFVPLYGRDLSACVEYIPGTCKLTELSARVDSGEFAAVFAVESVPVEIIMSIADAGQVLPPKATYFDPKPLSGLVNRLL